MNVITPALLMLNSAASVPDSDQARGVADIDIARTIVATAALSSGTQSASASPLLVVINDCIVRAMQQHCDVLRWSVPP